MPIFKERCENLIIEKIKIEKLNPSKYNPRKDLKAGDPEYERLKKSIETFGYVEPVIWNKRTGNIVGGHQRLKILKEQGQEEVDCVVVDMDESEEKALNVALNKVSGDWDLPKLADLIEQLDADMFDISLTGFDMAEVEDLFSQVHDKDIEDDDFDVDGALEEESFVKFNDIWLLGKHRLLCGDATDKNDMAKLMDGKKANLCITDPPYNCDYTGGTGMKIQNDNMSDSSFKQFLLDSFKNIYDNLVDGGAFYSFHSDAEKVNFFNATVEAGFHYSTTCLWVKQSLVLSRMDYHMRHEPIIYAFKNTAKHKWYGGRKLTTVWEFDRPTKSKLHPTSKPLDLIGFPMKNSSIENSIILDPFGGSGSTLIASEQLNRICYMSELDPKYAAVIIKRYIKEVGTDEEVYLLRDGEKIKYKDVVKEQ
ncbi:site-specific DNA-methyltransferase [Tissierella creatinophila]|uniref:Modification methylase MboII n=1 Tax=Tissierella creatinophila DSM 6911 TaxID=1123403 RepID=A0A1U7M5L5_TISCR|nr:site-specific DNA-methyltransferase [Tissierella creatinophila]OLS02575.1 modification methylase MboII [Tissierella creatinophila DSM 6911]